MTAILESSGEILEFAVDGCGIQGIYTVVQKKRANFGGL